MFRQRFSTSDDAPRSLGLGNGALVIFLPRRCIYSTEICSGDGPISCLFSRHERSAGICIANLTFADTMPLLCPFEHRVQAADLRFAL